MGDKNKRMSRMYLEEKKVNPDEEKIVIPPRIGYEDMTKMEDMDLNGVLNNLKDRYVADLVYTYTSSILVAINPFKKLNIYSKPWVKYYKGKRLGLLPPHVFAVSESAFTQMVETGINQSCLVSGESGAGKTETTKLILQYLSARTDRQSNIETMVLESVPVLEAFGNAKTGRNDNSSRFGKFIEIQFDNDFYINGSKITPYLLEKSRLISQAKGERNYHIFYQIAEGGSAEEKERYHLQGGCAAFNITNHSGCISIKGVDDGEEFRLLKKAMGIFEITNEIQDDIFKLTAACLHLGNIDYSANGEGSSPKNDKAKQHLAWASELLCLEGDALEYALTHKKIKMRSEIINKPMNVEQALDQTNALIKYLYSEMFEWLVRKLNECTYTEVYKNWIGVLDIFGFELFEHNSFEQFLINFANEKLQNFFNHHIFKLEQVEYEKEGIDWTAIDFVDNQPCLDLIEQRRPPGILSILDEESKFPKATDETFIQKLHGNFEKKHESYDKPKLAKNKFIVKHYAGHVEYDIVGWRDKNKDELPEHLVELVRKSSNKFIAILYAPEGSKDGSAPAQSEEEKKSGKQTLGGFFKQQLTDLMSMLSETTPYFIRCVKPNMAKVPDKFDNDLVYNQLLYAGMLETIRIRRMGYPIRYKHEEFWRRYRVICPEVDIVKGDLQSSCQKLCNALGIKSPQNFQLGNTKVFLKQEMANELEDRRNLALTHIIKKVQTWWRMVNLRSDFNAKREKSVVVQKWWRRCHARKNFKTKRAGAFTIQKWWRMAKDRKKYLAMLAKKRKEEEERRIKEEKEREERIKKLGKEKVEAEEAAKKAVEEAEKEAEMEKLKALQNGDISLFNEEKPAEQPPAEEEEEKKKKKKKKEGDGLERDKRGSIMMKKGMQLEIPINVDGTVTLGLGWKGGQWDMDASCLMFRFKQHRDDVYYYKPRSKDGAIVHRGGYAGLIRVNAEDGDAEKIDINLSKVSAKTNTLIFVVTVFSPEGNFSSVQDAYVRLVDTSTGSEYCRYTLEGGGSETARIMCRLYRYGYSKWRLQAIGEPSEGRLYKHMITKVEPFLDDMPAKRRFRIRVHRGNLCDIKKMYKGEKTTSLNTFCELRLDTDKSKTKVIKKSLTPKWQSTAELKGHSNILEINIMHKTRFGKDVTMRSDFRKIAFSDSLFLGRCLIPLDTDNVQIKEQWYKLEQRDKARGRGQTAVTGEVKLTIQEILY